MPGLSSSTLNLKFMQRATARAPAPAPASTPSTPGASSSKAYPSNSVQDTPTELDPPLPNETVALIASEEPYRWTLNRPSRPEQGRSGDMLIPKSTGVKFESSYLPFMDAEGEAGPSTSTLGGGGRMVFGYKEPEQEDLEKEEGSDVEMEGEDDDVVINVRDKDRGKGKREHTKQQQRIRPMAGTSTSKGFIRPKSRSASPEHKPNVRHDGQATRAPLIPMSTKLTHRPTHASPSTNTSSDITKNSYTKHKDRGAVKADSSGEADRAEPNGKGKKRKQSQSGAAADHNSPKTAITGDKKPRLEPSMLNDHPSQASKKDTPATSIDEREQALKAQRKKEKNARKKARKSNEKNS